MGIQGLLPFLKSIQRPTNVSSYRGGTVAVDAYCWLHKGAFSCAQQIVMKEGNVENLPFVTYCMKRVNMLRENNIKVIMVFDGGYLPVKAGVESERRARRQEYRKRGKELLKEGKRSEAIDCFQKCVDVSPEMALAFIKACRRVDVECIVAPYEADAQLAYLSREGIVDLVITEDSDLLVFGSKRVLFKMDENGNGVLIELSRLGQVEGGKLQGFDENSFRHMCILSGCDYLPSIPGMGLATANKMLKKFGRDPHKVIAHLKMQKGKAVPKLYSEGFKQAEETFLFQLVFDTRTQKQTRLNPPPDGVEPDGFGFAGSEVSPRKAVGLARGNINPLTFEVMAHYSPSKADSPLHSDRSPLRHKGWVGPVMGGNKQYYPLGVQAKMPTYSSSRKSAGQFKPPTLAQHDDGVCLTNSELLTMYSTVTGDKEQSTGEGDVVVQVGEGGSTNHQQSPSGETAQPHTGARRTTISRFFKPPEAAAGGDGTDEVTPASSQPTLLSRLVGCRELQFSEQQGEEDGRRQRALEESGCKVSKNLAELFADREEEESSKARERTTAGVCYQGEATDEERDREPGSEGGGCNLVLQHPMRPVSEAASSEGALDPRCPSTESVIVQPIAPPAKKIRRSLQSFLFTPHSSDSPSQQAGVSMKMECDTKEPSRFMQQEDFLSSGIGYLRQALPGENERVPSPPPFLPTQGEGHSSVSTLLPKNQLSTIDLTADTLEAANAPTVLGRVRQRAASTTKVKRLGLSRPMKSKRTSFRTPQCSESQAAPACQQSTLTAVLLKCQYTKREGMRRS